MPIVAPMLAPTLAVAALVLLQTAAPARPSASSEAVKLAPHRAVYDMTLGEARSGSGISSISGRMVFEFTGAACKGYTLNMRLVTQLSDRDGQSRVTDLRSSTLEKGDGSAFRFNSTQYLDEKLNETVSGEALRTSDGGATVKITKPSPSTRSLPAGVMFPSQHSIAVLNAAKAGRTPLQATVFDGSENGEKLYDTSAFIGKPLPAGHRSEEKHVANDEVLEQLTSWPVTISYFERGAKGDTTPAYELSFRLYGNGVSRELQIDYGDFVLRGALRSLDILPAAACQ